MQNIMQSIRNVIHTMIDWKGISLLILLLIAICIVFVFFIIKKKNIKKQVRRYWNIDTSGLPEKSFDILFRAAVLTIVLVAVFFLSERPGLVASHLNVSYLNENVDRINVMTTTATVFATLMTVQLALIALAVTAYVFLNDVLANHDKYEQNILQTLRGQTRERLFKICIFAGLCIVIGLIVDNAVFTTLSAEELQTVRIGTVLISMVDIVLLIVYIIKIVNYDKWIVALARSYIKVNQRHFKKEKMLQTDSEDKNNGANATAEVIKKIGDIENLLESILKNHESEYRFQSGQNSRKILNTVLGKKVGSLSSSNVDDRAADVDTNIETTVDDYLRLVEIRNCIWILQQYGQDVKIQSQPLLSAIDSIGKPFLKFAYASEQFLGLTFNETDFSNGMFFSSSMSKSAFIQTIFENANLANCDFSGSLLRKVDFTDANCDGAVFSGARIVDPIVSSKTSFKNTVFRNSEFTAAEFKSSDSEEGKKFDFSASSCQYANFVGVGFTGINFGNSALSEASFADSKLIACNFSRADLEKAVFANARISRDCNFPYANCSYIIGSNSIWGESKSPEHQLLDLTNTRFLHANLAYAKLDNCNFRGAYMDDTSFVGANINNCEFSRAMLSKTDFTDSMIDNCCFNEAILRDGLFISDKATILPQKLNAEDGKPNNGNDSGTIKNSRFSKAELVNCNVKNHIFEDCIFDRAVFNGSSIRDTTFIRCRFDHTDFSNTSLIDVIWIDCVGCIEKNAKKGINFGTKDDQIRWENAFLRRRIVSHKVEHT